MITKFSDVFATLKADGICKRLVAAWAVDSHTIEAASKAVDLGIITATLVGDQKMIAEVCEKEGIDIAKFTIVDEPVELKAVAKAVELVRAKEGDVLMKGLCSTDKFLRAILNKETGLLPPKGVLSHVGVIENPQYHKLIFLTDMAVIPQPDFRQKVKITGYVTDVARAFGIAKPKVAFIAASEQMLDSMPACIEAAMLAKMCDRGPATPTASCSPTSSPPTSSGRPTPSSAPVCARPECLSAPPPLASSQAGPTVPTPNSPPSRKRLCS